ncbi:FHA domain-containing protein [Frankia sp. CNm7]|uniref:FHA domain-containing protein n=1 Tax=Frankia nepalensis TaxID=1836974 RepID=A0A937URW5_9ACTN|nr:FHA domain-containing protein [Frankia nepalensis]MBL7495820.1 FHA domain-containing protein [Frankia nepalensis]MBL7509896.1 FHA domain-containing protein [Frankia nepalensis]MBL7517637.1 FHA domain-containing protein [Frankia nepalensis]MBL7629655.1 FHA domain-containing protein [Frankia nepalensis]
MSLTINVGGRSVEVPAGRPFVVGRAVACDLVIPDGRVSRRHLLVEPVEDGWAVVDISSNGTWTAGRRMHRVRVRQETRLQLGAVDGPEVVVALTPGAPTTPTDLGVVDRPAQAAPAARAGGPSPQRVSDSPAPGAPPHGSPASPAAPGRQAAPAGRPQQDPDDRPSWHFDNPAGPPTGGHHERPTMIPGGREPTGPMLPPGEREQRAGQRDPVRTHPLKMGRMSIGRARSNDIVVGDLLASREHAELLLGRGGAEIVDLGSPNGTFLNGQRIDRAVLNPGDVIAIGHHVFNVTEQALVERVDTGDVSFEVDGLSVDIGTARLLHDVTFSLPGRALLAVIGPSGAGKSTLLGALTGFRPANIGTVRYAGRDLYAEYDELRRRIGYVPQDDILHTALTVRQALEYGSKLRFPAETTLEERRNRVNEVLVELSLTNRPGTGGRPNGRAMAAGADSNELRFVDEDEEPGAPSGGDLSDRQVARLSGGQRKRTSVALELLTQPTLLYLDEPTSGLDPGLDKEVMESLRRLADGGRTVIVVTHSVAQLNLCDYLLVLAKGGHVAYFGPPQHALEFFDEADWADAFRVLQTTKGAKRLASRFRSSPYFIKGSAPMARPQPAPLARIRQQSVLSQLVTLSRRYLRVIVSDKSYLRLLIAYPFVLGLIPLTIKTSDKFNLPPNGQPNLDASRALLVVILMACFMGMSNAVRELVKEREIYRRERSIGLSVIAYVGSKVVVLSLITALQGAVLATIGLWGRWPPDGVLFGAPLEMVLAVAATAVAAAMVGLIVSSVVDNADKTMPPLVVLTVANLVFTGALMPIAGEKGLEQLAWLFPGRWGYASAAAVGDINVIQMNGSQANPKFPPDPMWEHTASAYAGGLIGLAVIATVSLIATALLLRRLDPRASRGRRKG